MHHLRNLVQANIVTYNAAISACGNAGQWQHALATLQNAINDHLHPDAVSISACITGCGSAQWELGIVLLEA